MRALLIAFAFAVSAPLMLLLAVLLIRSTTAERAGLEERLLQVASNLTELIERDIDRSIALLQTLATSPAISSNDWPTFYEQARAALRGRAYLVFVDSTGRQLVNTYVAFGTEPPFTGDPETVKRMLTSSGPIVSNLFVSLVVKEPVYNISIPVIRDGSVGYIMSLGLLPDDLAQILRKLNLNPSWVTTIWDRNGVILARSRDHESFLAQKLPDTLRGSKAGSGGILRTTNLDGEKVLLAVATSKISGWGISVGLPIAVAEAGLRSSIWLWGLASAATLAIAMLLGLLIGRLLMGSLSTLSHAARVPIGKQWQELPTSSVQEINEVAHILYETRTRQRLLLLEVSHRAKNMLAVVQALVTHTLRGDASDRDRQQLIIERLHALARAHDALVAGSWSGIRVSDIVNTEVATFRERVTIEGPPVLVKPDVVESITLILHELMTNAIKYGALSSNSGQIDVSWRIDNSDDVPSFQFEWREFGGPQVGEPTKQGLGTRLLRQALSGAVTEVAFRPEGVVYRFSVFLAAITVDPNEQTT